MSASCKMVIAHRRDRLILTSFCIRHHRERSCSRFMRVRKGITIEFVIRVPSKSWGYPLCCCGRPNVARHGGGQRRLPCQSRRRGRYRLESLEIFDCFHSARKVDPSQLEVRLRMRVMKRALTWTGGLIDRCRSSRLHHSELALGIRASQSRCWQAATPQ